MLANAWIVVFLCGATLYTTDAQITGWSVPSISGTASGTGAAAITFPEDQTVGATTTSFTATPTSPDTIASYTLLTSDTPFSVTSSSGLITLDSALDFETTPSYTVEVRAVDTNASPNTGTATVTITVTNVNEAPTFSAALLSACVADGSTEGQTVTTLTATDQDTGDTITYSVNSGDTSNHFTFSGAELQVSTGTTLDKSTTPSYTLIVNAVDDDSSPLTGTATVTVTVGDCSSASGAQITGWTFPTITGASGTGAIRFPEDQATGATSTTFSATPSSGAIASYTLLTAGTPFSINSSSGLLNLDSALDFETTASYTIGIRAVDDNKTPHSGTATVSITVTDVNEAPTFSAKSFTACVADASTAGLPVTTLTATDQDAGDTITYSINSGDSNNDFTFSGAELQVSSGTTLDMSNTASYTLVIHAADDGGSPLTGTTTLTLTVGTDCNSASILAISVMMTLMALVVSLY